MTGPNISVVRLDGAGERALDVADLRKGAQRSHVRARILRVADADARRALRGGYWVSAARGGRNAGIARDFVAWLCRSVSGEG